MKTGGRDRLVALALRCLLGAHAMIMRAATRLGPRKRQVGEEGYDILLTGTFHSANWIQSHVKPLALSRRCRRVRIVTAFPVPPIEKVEVIPPGIALSRLLGDVPARMITFVLVALRRRPDVLGGFHLLLNGLAASLVGRMCGARSMYFCVGGPAEVLGGGVLSENRLFEKLRAPDERIESMLLRAVGGFDLIVTMGHGAKTFFRERGVGGEIRVVSGGIEAVRFMPESAPPAWDVVFVGRLVPIKRLDVLIRALGLVRRDVPSLKAVFVGDGPLRPELEALTTELGLEGAVEFAGSQPDVASFLRRGKIFVLTSATEGLSLALMEAMMAGLPAVVSDVGDLGDIVRDGHSGFLVRDRTPERFAERIALLLRDGAMRDRLGAGARAAMAGRETRCVVRQWDAIFDGWRNDGTPAGGAGRGSDENRTGAEDDRQCRAAESERCAESQVTPA